MTPEEIAKLTSQTLNDAIRAALEDVGIEPKSNRGGAMLFRLETRLHGFLTAHIAAREAEHARLKYEATRAASLLESLIEDLKLGPIDTEDAGDIVRAIKAALTTQQEPGK